MIYIILVAIASFLGYLVFIHKHTEISSAAATKILVDSVTYDVTDSDISHPHKKIVPSVSHFDELVQAILELTPYKQVFSSPSVHNAVSQIAKMPMSQKYIKVQKYNLEDPVPFNKTLGYGGVYFENKQKCNYVYVVGNTEDILKMCSHVLDKEEILRVSSKWQKQGLLCTAIATGDIGHSKNVLKRGVKEKMMFLGVIGIKS
jgi:hypothetical protein